MSSRLKRNGCSSRVYYFLMPFHCLSHSVSLCVCVRVFAAEFDVYPCTPCTWMRINNNKICIFLSHSLTLCSFDNDDDDEDGDRFFGYCVPLRILPFVEFQMLHLHNTKCIRHCAFVSLNNSYHFAFVRWKCARPQARQGEKSRRDETRRSNAQRRKNTNSILRIACPTKSFNMKIVCCFWFLINCIGEFVIRNIFSAHSVAQSHSLAELDWICVCGLLLKPWEYAAAVFLLDVDWCALRWNNEQSELWTCNWKRNEKKRFTFAFDGLTCGHVCGRRSHIYIFFHFNINFFHIVVLWCHHSTHTHSLVLAAFVVVNNSIDVIIVGRFAYINSETEQFNRKMKQRRRRQRNEMKWNGEKGIEKNEKTKRKRFLVCPFRCWAPLPGKSEWMRARPCELGENAKCSLM